MLFIIHNPFAAECLQKKALSLNEDVYYHILSAFCKSLRGSDATAALYYANRFIEEGCKPSTFSEKSDSARERRLLFGARIEYRLQRFIRAQQSRYTRRQSRAYAGYNRSMRSAQDKPRGGRYEYGD